MSYLLVDNDAAKLKDISNLTVYEYFQAVNKKLLQLDAQHHNKLRSQPDRGR
jgi:hypothetical protein